MKTHLIKLHEKDFYDISANEKRFEILLNDKDFKFMDNLIILEIDSNCLLTQRFITASIVYVQEELEDIIVSGFCIVGFKITFDSTIKENK